MKIFSYRRRKLFFFILIGIVLVKTIFYFENINNLFFLSTPSKLCDLTAAKRIIENLCQFYNEDNMVSGNICSNLCNPSNKFEYYKNYKLSNCYNQKFTEDLEGAYNAFKIVLIYENYANSANPKKLVLKSRHKHFLDFDFNEFDFEEKTIIDQIKFLADFFESTLQSHFGISMSKDVQNWIKAFESSDKNININLNINNKDIYYYLNLFAYDYKDFQIAIRNNDKILMAKFIKNLVILMSQDEYLFYRFFQSKPGVLKIYGFCGHLYLTEYAEPLTHKIRLMNRKERKNTAIKFLDLVHSLDNIYLLKDVYNNNILQTFSELNRSKLTSIPIHMCDAKLDNFGFSYNGELKLIDTDMLHTESYLFDNRCKSYCNQQRCIKTRVNNNLQTFCERIFDNELSKIDGIISGVDFSKNIDSEIKRRLEQCKNPGFYLDSKVIKAANESLISILKVLLHDSEINLN